MSASRSLSETPSTTSARPSLARGADPPLAARLTPNRVPRPQDLGKPQAQPIAPGPINPPRTAKELPAWVKDPVCGKDLVKSATRALPYKSVYQGKTYFFCSQHCKQEFDKDPKRYLNKTTGDGLISQQPSPSIIPGRDGRFRGRRVPPPGPVAPPVVPPAGGHPHD